MTTKKQPAKKVAKKAVAKKEVKKKAAPKKEAPKKTVVKKEVKPKVEIKEIKAKMIGKNLIVIIDGTKHTKKTPTTAEIKTIENKCKLYNKKNNDMLKDEIISLVNLEVVKKEKEVAVKKGLKKAIEKVKKEAKATNELTESKEVKVQAEEKKIEANITMTVAEMEELERESKRTLRRSDRGYKHPVTGRTWDGEKYV